MTKEEAIKHFEYGITHDIFKEPVTSYAKLAISALRQPERPKGRWTISMGDLHRNGRFWHCTACGKNHFVPNRNAVNGAVPSRHYELPPYCPNCGAEMVRGEEE